MDSTILDQLQQTLQSQGADQALTQLCDTLRRDKDYTSLFYALLLKKRHELGIAPVLTNASSQLSEQQQLDYEDGIRAAGREVGQLYLDDGNISRAWAFFRMLGEPEPVARALDAFQLNDEEDCQELVEIAFHQGVNPKKGFDMILNRYGICSAITTMGSGELPFPPDVRNYCITRLVVALHEQLVERLHAEIAAREGTAPSTKHVPELIANRAWLFDDEFYHVDVSHLGAVVQMSVYLTPCPELKLARELCAYGQRLSPRYQNPGDPPFDDLYKDIGVYLSIIDGDQVEEGLAYFRAKVENPEDPDGHDTLPAEVLINLLLRLDRLPEALDVARQHLADVEERQLTCPSLTELCQRMDDYQTLAGAARQRGDAVNYLAGLLAQQTTRK
ncbi:MAG: hypothetical protein ACK4RK_00970 [Gemmataceae bacterium]